MSAALIEPLAAALAGGVRAYAAVMLIVAGGAKLRALPDFIAALAAYRLLPSALVAPAARLLPVAEIAVGVALLLPPAASAAAWPAALLLLLFAAAVAINLLRGRTELDCGCGTRTRIGWRLVSGNVVLAVCLAASAGAASAAPLVTAGGAVLGAGLWLAARVIGAMAALARPSPKLA